MIRLILAFCLLTFPALANKPVIYIHGEPRQGEMLFGNVPAKARLYVNGERLVTRKDGWFMIGIGRDDTGKLKLKIQDGKKTYYRILKIKPRKWKIQRVDGLPQNKVTPDPKEVERITKENEITAKARDTNPKVRLPLCFQMPTKGRISSVYGSQRIMNGIPGASHNALDIAAPTGTKIVAPAAGRVLLVYDEMFLSGKTVLIGHGQDVTTSYIHLNKINVKQGDLVKKGQKIGEIGTSGRSTGPHLHWTVAWKNTRVDPQVFLKNSRAFCN